MTSNVQTQTGSFKQDLSASLVVFLVALPLCLGIAMASGAPLFSGLIAGIVGGIVVGALSKSPLSVSGPAAGLTVIVLNAINTLPSYEAFLLAVCLAGLLQVGLGVVRAGTLGDYVPSYVINGLLSAIGLVLILKQIPHAVGYDGNFEGDEAFMQMDQRNTFSTLVDFPMEYFSPLALIISVASLVFLFWWDKRQPKMTNILRYIPGPLVVVVFGITANLLALQFAPGMALGGSHLVGVPVTTSAADFFGQLSFPDVSYLMHSGIWMTAITLALVASIESILSVEAIDKLDPKRRHTPPNRELLAQGAGNFFSGIIGGMPVTSVIVRSSANVAAGADSKRSTIMHGLMLLVCVVSIPHILNLIPLAALAAVLISIGYKLAKPEIFIAKYRKGMRYFVPFMATVIGIVLSDPMIGIGIGLLCGVAFMVVENLRASIVFSQQDDIYTLRCKKDLFFIHKPMLKSKLSQIPQGSTLVLDFTEIHYMDKDNIELLHEFVKNAHYRDISVKMRAGRPHGLSRHFKFQLEAA
jgi:MFS superfamily sulfate permease-like transporter